MIMRIYISKMVIKIMNTRSLTPPSITSHIDVQLDSSKPPTTVLVPHWLRPRSIDAEIGTIRDKALKRGCNCMERPKTLVAKLNVTLKIPPNSTI